MSPPRPSTSIRAHLCGRRHSVNLHLSPHDPNTTTIENALLRHFGVDERSFRHTLLWHFRAEACQVQRPFADLGRMAGTVPEILRRESLRVHVCRAVGLVPGPGYAAVGGGVVGGVAAGPAVASSGESGGGGARAGGAGEVLGGGTIVPGQARTEHLDGETEAPGDETGVSGDRTKTVGQGRVVSGGEGPVTSAEVATAGRATTGSDEEATTSNADTIAPGESAGVIDEDAGSGAGADADEAAEQRCNHAVHAGSSNTAANSSSSEGDGSPSQSAADNSSEPPSPRPSPPSSDNSATVADEVAFHLKWSPETCQQLGRTPHTFSNIRTQLDDDLVGIRERIRDDIVRVLQLILQQFPQVRDLFRDTIAIRYRAVVGIVTGGHDVVDLEDASYGGRFTDVSDLFVDPTTAPLSVNVAVTLLLDDGSDSSPAAKKRKMSKISTETPEFDQLVRSTQDDANPRRRLVRLGEVSERELSEPDDIAEEFPILAEIDREQRTLIFLWETRAWSFDDFCIGGFELSKKTLRFSQRLLWFDGYHGVNSKSQLQDRISARVTTDARMPFLPPLTFNTFGPDEYDPPLGTGAINKEYGAVIVIRFVCHLPKAENERLAFHKNFQIVVGDSDTFESISHEINKDLEAAEETKRLFRVEYRDSWQLHLWAMPHAPAPRTLFRFEPSGSDGPSLVKRFMSLRMLKRKHGGSKLYMEAHLWEVDDDEDAKLVRHHAETGTEHASGPRDSDVHEDSWLEGSGPSQQGSRRGAATKKPGFARSGGAKMSDSSQPQERGGISVIPRDQLEDVSDQASSATEGEDLCYAAAREQSRLLFEDEQLRLAIELSEREMLEGLPPDESLSWNALSGEDTSDLGEDAADRSSEVYEDGSGGGGGDRDSDAQDLETQDEDEDEDHDSPESRHGVDHSKAARVESEQRSSENSGPEQEKASQADVCDGNDGEAGEDIEADDESSWLIHVPASLREEQRRQ
ncbi:hypothetical protein B0A54_16260 [Friedmanniomyces endolithicus]|uniref:Uncharacterized protein n=1 Tax=Friedmanniomyces endolithicus TaxID=329885 RepID=A0A4U0U183_9PEZI|nr:hypothetical protein LTS09_015426 [Friedmanniomyces endolithicus]TKA28578.1 hypothetical protein B0A54_16260 [Friedmanniomyces endolithicus]